MIPESSSSVTIDNRFGDIHMGDIEGRVNITLAHGNLRVNKLQDYCRLDVNYGKAKIKEINEGRMSFKGGELELEYASKLNLNSSSSQIEIDKVLVIDLESTNDKIVIAEVHDISGSANFTEMSISYLNNGCRLDQSYGSMTIKHIMDGFKTVRVNGKSTDYRLIFSKGVSFESRIYARDDKLSIANYSGKREKRYMDEKSKFVQLSGNFGNDTSESKLNINAQNGEVKIDFTEVLSESYNK